MLNFIVQQVNSPFDDSAFFLRNVYHKRALLLDCGKLGGLDHSSVLSLGHVFVSHTHMDHFVGFDKILRGSLLANHELTFYGPPGFVDNIDGKFRSYTWNLIDDYTFSIKAYEFHPSGNHLVAKFMPCNRFKPVIEEFCCDNGKVDIGDNFTMSYEFFDHQIISMGFRISEPVHHKVEVDKLLSDGFKQGPWLSEFKTALLKGDTDKIISAKKSDNDVPMSVAALAKEYITIKPPQVVTYITDCAPTEENIEKAVKFAADSSLLIIESVFLDEDIEHAKQKNHLTLGIAKDIFNRSNSELVRFTHFAPRYEQDKGNFLAQVYDGMSGKVHTINYK